MGRCYVKLVFGKKGPRKIGPRKKTSTIGKNVHGNNVH